MTKTLEIGLLVRNTYNGKIGIITEVFELIQHGFVEVQFEGDLFRDEVSPKKLEPIKITGWK